SGADRADWAAGMAHSGLLVGIHAHVPDLGGFHLCCSESPEEGRRQMRQAIHTNCFHVMVFFFSAAKAVMGRMAAQPGGVTFIPPLRRGWAFPLQSIKFFYCSVCSLKPTRKEIGSRTYKRGGSSVEAWALVGIGVTGREIGLPDKSLTAGRLCPVIGNVR